MSVCLYVMQGAPLYTFVIVFKCKVKEYSNNTNNIGEILCETLCDTIYHLLIVFVPLFIIAVCCLTGGEGGDFNCSVSNIEGGGAYNGTVYDGRGRVTHTSELEMV